MDNQGLEPYTSGLQPDALPVKLIVHIIMAEGKGFEPLQGNQIPPRSVANSPLRPT